MCRRVAWCEPGTLSATVNRHSTGGARPFFFFLIGQAMSYQVLARKWRPQTFDDVVGQGSITQTLSNAIRLDRIGHAFLFSGSRGIGKTTTARILAKALNCESGPTPEPCNTCRHCTEITSGIAMDVIEIDGASNRGIDEIRELRENVKYSPATGRYKVVIIDEVHMLTREAFNALLKTLEEPPEHAKFILATTEAHKVPVTILSRCQRYDFRRIDAVSLSSFLRDICQKESIQVEDRTLAVLARMADGGVRDSLSLLDQVISFSGDAIDHDQTMALLGRIDPDLLFDVFRHIAAGTGSGALDRFGAYIDNGGDESVFNREMMELTRDIMAVKMGGSPRFPLAEDLPTLYEIDQLERIFNVLLNLEQSFRYTEHPRLLMDVALVKMARIRPLTALEDILARLNQMKSSSPIPVRNNQQTPAPQRTIPRPIPVKPVSPGAPPKPSRPPRQTPPATPAKPETPKRPPTTSPRHPAAPPHKSPSQAPPHPPTPVTKPHQTSPQQSPKMSPHKPPISPKPMAPGGSATKKNGKISSDINEPQHLKPIPVKIEDKPDTDNSPLKQLSDQLPDRHAPLKGMLHHAAVVSFDDSSLAIAFHPNDRVHHEFLSNYEDIESLLHDASVAAFGTARQVIFSIGGPDTPRTIVDQEQLVRQQAEQRLLDMARSKPVVAKVLTMFRGEIKKIKIKNESEKSSAIEGDELLEDSDNDE